jgi:hypothetical protein
MSLGLRAGESGVWLGGVGFKRVGLGQHLLHEAIGQWIPASGFGVIARCREGYGSGDVAARCGCGVRGAGWPGNVGARLPGGVYGEACVLYFGDEAVGEPDGGEQGAGDGALDAALAECADDEIEGDEHGLLVDKRREIEGLGLGGLCCRGGLRAGFLLWTSRVVVAAEFGAVNCGCGALLAVAAGLKALSGHKVSLQLSVFSS